MRADAEREQFVRTHARLERAPLVPEIALWLASEATELWQATSDWLAARDVPAPFWAFAWAGGQALARFVLDRPELVRGRAVLDFACGGGIVAIAAARAGASRVVAVDVDPFAITACRMNAHANRVTLEIACGDALDYEMRGLDTLLAGDVWYEAPAAARFESTLRDLARRGVRVLTGDPARHYVPSSGVVELAQYDVSTPEGLEGAPSRLTRVLEITA